MKTRTTATAKTKLPATKRITKTTMTRTTTKAMTMMETMTEAAQLSINYFQAISH
jgi:hypothetical protein